MSAPATTTTVWQWPAEVLEFAAESNVGAYLDPMLQATHRIFPTASIVKVTVETDPEIRDDRHIVFDVSVPRGDLPNYLDSQHRWIRALYDVCPAPLVCTFRLLLVTIGT